MKEDIMKFFRSALLALFLFLFCIGGVSSQSVPVVICEYGEPVLYGPAAGPYFFTPHAIVIHHSADSGATAENEALRWEGYRRYHKETVHPGVYPEWTGIYIAQQDYPDGLSWPDQKDYNDIDYHYGIGPSGTIYQGRDSRTVGWHAGGALPGMPEINSYSLGVCFIGDFTNYPPNNVQYQAGVKLVADLCIQYKISFTEIYGHKEIRGTTACPGNAFPLIQFKEDVRMQIAGFYDFDYSHWAWANVRKLTSSGLVKGYGDKTLKPENPITRAEFIFVLWKMNGSPVPRTYGSFVDVWGHWAEKAISWAIETGLVKGYDNGFFYPDQSITRAEIATVIFRYLQSFPSWENYFSDIQGHWAKDFINTCHREGLLNGYPDGTFRPDNPTTRAEAFAVLARLK